MARPLAVQRHHDILARIAQARAVSVEELAGLHGVSHETIRRDLKRLALQGRVELVHGGALIRETAEPPHAERARANAEGKAVIAALALARIADGMVVLLDSGTTTQALAAALAASGRKGLTVCTSALAHAQILVRAGHRVTLLGGEVDRDDEATLGVDVVAALARWRIDCAFVGVGGLSPDGVVTDFSRAAAEQRRAMLDAAGQGFLLADHHKFGRAGPVVVPLGVPAPVLIVDRMPPAIMLAALARRGLAPIAP